MLNHEFQDSEIVSKLEESGYNSLNPAILPQELEKICAGDARLEQCLREMFTYVNRYAHDVYSMMVEQIELSEKRADNNDTPEDYEALRETDLKRHNLHEALIDSINILSKELNRQEKDAEWMRELVSGGRPAYTRFALLTFYRLHVKLD